MDLKKIRMWNTEFFNHNHLAVPRKGMVIHRLVKNLEYYQTNYALIFAFLFICYW